MSPQSEWISLRRELTINAQEDMEKEEPCGREECLYKDYLLLALAGFILDM